MAGAGSEGPSSPNKKAETAGQYAVAPSRGLKDVFQITSTSALTNVRAIYRGGFCGGVTAPSILMMDIRVAVSYALSSPAPCPIVHQLPIIFKRQGVRRFLVIN
jgi:hypothetical protein